VSEKKITAVGRRKEASARAKLVPGKGLIQINGKAALEYLGNDRLISIAQIPLKSVSLDGKYDIYIKVSGGGKKGQAEAIRHAITRALIKEDESLKPTLRKLGYVTRDPRTKERKKYGLKKARKAPQFSKR
jgi:small subunit ribosomal protein S9